MPPGLGAPSLQHVARCVGLGSRTGGSRCAVAGAWALARGSRSANRVCFFPNWWRRGRAGSTRKDLLLALV